MIDVNAAYRKFTETCPKLTVMHIYEYGNASFLFQAQENPNEVDYNNPYYSVSKSDGSINYFSPLEDIDAFREAITKHEVPIPKGSLKHSDEDYLRKMLSAVARRS